MSKLLLISILLYAFPSAKGDSHASGASCESLAVRAIISEPSTGNYRVSLAGEGGQEPYKYIFYKKSGELISKDFEKIEYQGLEKGEYGCTIIDKKNCRKNIEVNIR